MDEVCNPEDSSYLEDRYHLQAGGSEQLERSVVMESVRTHCFDDYTQVQVGTQVLVQRKDEVDVRDGVDKLGAADMAVIVDAPEARDVFDADHEPHLDDTVKVLGSMAVPCASAVGCYGDNCACVHHRLVT